MNRDPAILKKLFIYDLKKKSLHIILSCIVFLCTGISAQNKTGPVKLDSLKQALNLSAADSNRLEIYQNLYALADSLPYAEKGLAGNSHFSNCGCASVRGRDRGGDALPGALGLDKRVTVWRSDLRNRSGGGNRDDQGREGTRANSLVGRSRELVQ